MDRRVRRTRRQLNEAMLSLLVERNYEDITIQGITERADLNRATFYHHFNHKDELLAAALEARFDELVASFGKLPTDSTILDDRTPELLTFRHVAQHADLYKVLLSDRGMAYIIYRIIHYIAHFAETKWFTAIPRHRKSNVPDELLAQHIAGSLFALLSWWVTNDLPYSAEEMAEIAHTLCTNGLISVLDPQHPQFNLSAPATQKSMPSAPKT